MEAKKSPITECISRQLAAPSSAIWLLVERGEIWESPSPSEYFRQTCDAFSASVYFSLALLHRCQGLCASSKPANLPSRAFLAQSKKRQVPPRQSRKIAVKFCFQNQYLFCSLLLHRCLLHKYTNMQKCKYTNTIEIQNGAKDEDLHCC